MLVLHSWCRLTSQQERRQAIQERFILWSFFGGRGHSDFKSKSSKFLIQVCESQLLNEPVIYLIQLWLEELVSWAAGFAAAQMPLAKPRFKSGAAGKCRKFHSAQLISGPYCLALEIHWTGSPCFHSAGGRLKLCPVQIQHCAKTQSFPMRPIPSFKAYIRYHSQILLFVLSLFYFVWEGSFIFLYANQMLIANWNGEKCILPSTPKIQMEAGSKEQLQRRQRRVRLAIA